MFAIANDRKSLWQWDLNQQLTVAGDCTEVHYLDRGAPSTLTVAVKDGKADIPNILLQKAGRLVVYAYIIDAQDHHTKVCETFGIASRPKPAEYVYTKTEVKTWSGLQSQIGNLANLATKEKDNLVAAINEAAQSGGGGAGAWYVTITPDDGGNITADKTMAEIEAAYQAGYAVYCIFLYDVIFAQVPVIAPLTIHRENAQYIFCGVGAMDKLYSFQFELKESGWTVLQKEIPQKSDIPAAYILPKATANALGGVKAAPATASDTQPVRIDDSGKLVTAAGSGNISLGLTSAAVGQTIKVKTVDTDGRPTSWEAADMVSGSGEVWEKVAEVTTTEEVASIELILSDTCTKICVVDNVPPFESSDGKQPSHLKIVADDITVTVPANYITPHNLHPQTRSYWIIPLGDISWTFMTDVTMNAPYRELAVKGNYADYSKTTISKIKYSVSIANSNRYMIPAGTKVTVYGVKK